jgi:hypothetical protein
MVLVILPHFASNLSLALQAVLTADLPFILKLPTILKILVKKALLAAFLLRQSLLLYPLIAAGRLECRLALRQPETLPLPFPIQDLVLEADRFLDRTCCRPLRLTTAP